MLTVCFKVDEAPSINNQTSQEQKIESSRLVNLRQLWADFDNRYRILISSAFDNGHEASEMIYRRQAKGNFGGKAVQQTGLEERDLRTGSSGYGTVLKGEKGEKG